MKPIAGLLVSALMIRALRRTFRRVCWVGAWPQLPPDTPLVLYTNHNNFFDGYLLHLLTAKALKRPATIWMSEWDSFPFFSAVGAQPFPVDDPKRRAATMRRTARFLRRQPNGILVYFPEGRLHPAEEGVLPLNEGFLKRMGGILEGAHWWPVAIHVTWWGESLPTVLLTGGAIHEKVDGNERARLESLLEKLRQSPPECSRPLLEGRHSPQEGWNFRFARRLFERYL